MPKKAGKYILIAVGTLCVLICAACGVFLYRYYRGSQSEAALTQQVRPAPAAPQPPGPPPCPPPPPGPPRPPLRLPFLEGLIPGMDSGDVLVVLEAMKMENEILAPRDGTVAQVVTTKGAVVDTGAPLVVLA